MNIILRINDIIVTPNYTNNAIVYNSLYILLDKYVFFVYNKSVADITQKVEYHLGKVEVVGSSPIISSIIQYLFFRYCIFY